MRKRLALLLTFAAVALCLIGCDKKQEKKEPPSYVVAGASAAGTSAVNYLASNTSAPIIWVMGQTEDPYRTFDLFDLLLGKGSIEALPYFNPDKLPSNVQVLRGVKINELNPSKKTIILSNDEEIPYRSLLLATGRSHSIYAPFDKKKHGLFKFANLSDLLSIQDYLDREIIYRIAIIGAGPVGVRLAEIFQKRGYEVVLIDQSSSILNREINPEASLLLQKKISNASIQLHLKETVTEITTDATNSVSSIRLKDGEKKPCQMVIFTVGENAPNLEFSKKGLLEMSSNSVVVKPNFATTISDVFCAGDPILIYNPALEQMVPSCRWLDAIEQGELAARAMLKEEVHYPGSLQVLYYNLFDYQVVSCGKLEAVGPTMKIEVAKQNDYVKVLVRENDKLKGFTIVGKDIPDDIEALKREISPSFQD